MGTNLSCPKCHAHFDDAGQPHVSHDGRILVLRCPACGHRAPARAFQRAMFREVRATARRDAIQNSKKALNATLAAARVHSIRIVTFLICLIARAATTPFRAWRFFLAARPPLDDQQIAEAVHAVYCPACEHQCSSAADVCVNCGHPLSEPTRPLIAIKGKPAFALITLGISLVSAIIFFPPRQSPPAAVVPEPLPQFIVPLLPTPEEEHARLQREIEAIQNDIDRKLNEALRTPHDRTVLAIWKGLVSDDYRIHPTTMLLSTGSDIIDAFVNTTDGSVHASPPDYHYSDIRIQWRLSRTSALVQAPKSFMLIEDDNGRCSSDFRYKAQHEWSRISVRGLPELVAARAFAAMTAALEIIESVSGSTGPGAASPAVVAITRRGRGPGPGQFTVEAQAREDPYLIRVEAVRTSAQGGGPSCRLMVWFEYDPSGQ